MTDRPTSVYIIECAGYSKIGVATNPRARLKGINTGSPVRAVLYGSREFANSLTAFEIESRLHRMLKDKRTNGEWFDIAPERALSMLKRQKPMRLMDPKARHDSVARWETVEPHDITNILTQA